MGRQRKIKPKEKDETSSAKSDRTPKKKQKSTVKSEADSRTKNMKKYKKIIKTTYYNKLCEKKEDLETRLTDKISVDSLIRQILVELAIKLREFEFHIRKQWQILKKFNLQEQIFREESQNLISTEKQRTKDYYREAIYKFEAAQIPGFEDKEVLKGKIFEKIKSKYQIDDDTLNELKSIFTDLEVIENEETLLEKRMDMFIHVLKSIVTKNPSLSAVSDYENKASLYQSKLELKRYEKELESKSGQTNLIPNLELSEEFTFKNSFNLQNNSFNELLTNSNQKLKAAKSDLFGEPSQTNLFGKRLLFGETEQTFDDSVKIDPVIKEEESTSKRFPELVPKLSNKEHAKQVKLSEMINFCPERISQCHDSIFDNYSQMAKNTEHMINESKKWIGQVNKSKILNDFYMKLTWFNKLSDFDIQILIYLTQIVVKDIVDAKLSEKNYEGDLHPEDLIDLLKRYKNDLH